MNIIRILLTTICISLLSSSPAVADMYDNDSCTKGQNILARLLNTLTSFGLFAAYSANFHIDGAPDSDTKCDANYYPTNCGSNSCSGSGVTHDPKGCTSCPILNSSKTASCTGSCNISDPTGCANGETCTTTCDAKGGVNVCFKYVSGINYEGELTYTTDCNWARKGWKKLYLLPPASLKVDQMGDKLCAQFWTVMGYQSIGCKYLPDCSVFSTSSSCYVSQACASDAYKNSRSLVAITSGIMQCVKDSINYLFVDQSECGSSTYITSYFPAFQNSMRKAVRAAVTLYFIFFGIRMCLGGEMPSKGEFFTFGAKYILVIYFSVGFFSHYDGYGNPIYDDGITKYMLPLFQDGATDLANIMYSAGGAGGLCDYGHVSYPTGYQYLSLWDALDCRILYYLGLDLSRLANASEAAGVAALMARLGAPTLLIMIIPGILSFQLVFAVFAIIFAIFIISITVYFINIIVLCTIAIAILVYMAPVFVPMALFPQTKGYFDGWLKLMISYSLQPMVVAAYMAMMLTIFDQTMFGDCYFTNHTITLKIGTVKKDLPFFLLCDPHASGSSCSEHANDSLTKCKETIGYQVNPIKSGSRFTDDISALFFNITILKPSVVGNMLSGLITLCLFAFLFYKFAELLSEFAAELTGGTNIGALAGNPMAIVNMAAKAAKAYIKYKMGDKKGAAKDAKSAIQSGSEAGMGAGKKRPPGGGMVEMVEGIKDKAESAGGGVGGGNGGSVGMK